MEQAKELALCQDKINKLEAQLATFAAPIQVTLIKESDAFTKNNNDIMISHSDEAAS